MAAPDRGPDSGLGGGLDVGSDSGPDSGLGGGPDSGLGGGPDGGPDSGPDSGLGGGPDSGFEEFAPGAVWVHPYPVRYAGTRFDARTTLIRLADGRVILHSPGPLDERLKRAIACIGPVGWIVAPGTFHHLHVAAAAAAFPEARVLICPGVEAKQPGLAFDGILGDRPPVDWAGEIELQPVTANRIIREVVLLHKPSRTLIVTDLIERIGDDTPGVDWVLKLWWKTVTFMWNKSRPAPEYRLGWTDRREAAAQLAAILDWEFDRIVLAHGDLVTEDAGAVAREAWAKVLRRGGIGG